jgi:hypothetical protein
LRERLLRDADASDEADEHEHGTPHPRRLFTKAGSPREDTLCVLAAT